MISMITPRSTGTHWRQESYATTPRATTTEWPDWLEVLVIPTGRMVAVFRNTDLRNHHMH